MQGAGAAEYAYRQLGVRRAATIHDGCLYADYLQQAFSNEFRDWAERSPVRRQLTRSDQYEPMLTRLAAGAPEMLYFPVFMPAAGHIISQARTTQVWQRLSDGRRRLFTPTW